jgi:lysophospholipase L1-like esterase
MKTLLPLCLLVPLAYCQQSVTLSPTSPIGNTCSAGQPQFGICGMAAASLNAVVSLPKYALASRHTQIGTAYTRILFIGDSTTAGIGDSTEATQPWLNSFPTNLVKAGNSPRTLVTIGLGVATTPDTRWTIGSGWALTSVGLGVGGICYQGTAPTESLVYTSTVNADSYYVYYAVGPSVGTYTFTATGGTPVVVKGARFANGVRRTLVTAASASTSNTLTVLGTITQTFVYGVEPIVSTQKSVLVGNAGVPGSTSSIWVQNPTTFGSIPFIRAFAPALTVVSLGINDATVSTPIPTYTANLQLLITAAKATGDVILMTMPPSQGSPYTTIEPQYVAATKSLAITNNIPIIDTFAFFGGAYNTPLMAGDAWHPNNSGYNAWANLIRSYIFPSM